MKHALLFFGSLLFAAISCTGEPPGEPPPAPDQPAAPSAPPPPKEKQLVVFAAASLREVFTKLGEDFERARPGVDVTFNFAGTHELRTQLEQGARVDVFASADNKHMLDLVVDAKVVRPATFARNEPVVVVAQELIPKLRTFADLAEARRIVIGTPEVPIGRYTLHILARAETRWGADFRETIEAQVVSRELNVKQVLSKVTLGEADAGIVYRTDAQAAGDRVGIVEIPAELNVVAEYPIAVVVDAAHPNLARAWVELVRSTAGIAALTAAGFLAP